MIGKKEPETVYGSFAEKLEALSGIPVPKAIDDIINAPVKHDTVCDKDKLIEAIEKIYL